MYPNDFRRETPLHAGVTESSHPNSRSRPQSMFRGQSNQAPLVIPPPTTIGVNADQFSNPQIATHLPNYGTYRGRYRDTNTGQMNQQPDRNRRPQQPPSISAEASHRRQTRRQTVSSNLDDNLRERPSRNNKQERLGKTWMTEHHNSENPKEYVDDSESENDNDVQVCEQEDVTLKSRKDNVREDSVIDMLSELDLLHADVATKTSSETDLTSAERTKLFYDRKTLMDLRYTSLAQIKPGRLPDIPEIILEQMQALQNDEYVYYRKPNENYFVSAKGPLLKLNKSNRIAVHTTQQTEEAVLDNVDLQLDADELKASDTIEFSTSDEQIPPKIDEVPGKTKHNEPEHKIKLLCDLCQTDGEDEIAAFYCADCNEFLCQNCARVHKRSRSSKHHSLLGEDEMPKGKSTHFNELTCEKHVHEPLKYFCCVHGQGCCTLCITTEHNQCKFEYIDDVARNYEQTEEYNACLKDVDDVVRRIQENTKLSEDFGEKIRQDFDEVISDIHSFRLEINRRLDELETSIKREMVRVKDCETAQLDIISDKCKSIMYEMVRIKADLVDKQQYKQRKQLFLSTKAAQNKIEEHSEIMKSIFKELTVKAYTFERNGDLLDILNSAIKLGTLQIKEQVMPIQRKQVFYRPLELARKNPFATDSGHKVRGNLLVIEKD